MEVGLGWSADGDGLLPAVSAVPAPANHTAQKRCAAAIAQSVGLSQNGCEVSGAPLAADRAPGPPGGGEMCYANDELTSTSKRFSHELCAPKFRAVRGWIALRRDWRN